MYFRQLQMTGFKSFADQTTIKLEPGITCIVGPNGCGKSNVLDSLRWVLGEQSSKALRGSHMQDVIFNGTDRRHAMGMAEVSVIFDNADGKLPVDYSEVEITRRLYRSGESEYLINQAPCRLTDIRELFMDTGIGTQAYSMIGQGQMAMILSQKPEDRRALFEEAAGIIKYKSRKQLAVRRLESAEQNLLRLQDIITEIERQMRTLKRQVTLAIRHRELTEQLRGVEIRGAWLQFNALREAVASLRTSFEAAQAALEKDTSEVIQLEARNEEMSLAQLEVDRLLMGQRDGVHQIAAEIERMERQAALLLQQVEFTKKEESQAGQELEQFRQRAIQALERAEAVGLAIAALESELTACESTLAERGAEHLGGLAECDATDAQVEALRAESVETGNALARAIAEDESFEARMTGLTERVEAIGESQAAESARQSALAVELETVRAEDESKRAEVTAIESEQNTCRQTQQENSQKLRSLNEQWQTAREKKSSQEARLNSLRELRDNYEGFALGVRAIMRAKTEGFKEMKGVVGPAGDLISTEQAYEEAIEAALGGAINNIIVECADDAKTAIGFLKEHKAGRVTFLPLDIIRGGTGDMGDNLKRYRGVIGPAIQYVTYEERLRPAIEQLLHSTVIVETLDDAVHIARSERNIPRLVTLDGEVVSSAGAVTGGAAKHQSRGMLGRSAEIAELEEHVKALQGRIAKLAAEGEVVTNLLQQSGVRLRELEQAAAAANRELSQLGVQVARKATDLENLIQAATSMARQQAAIEEEAARLHAEREAVRERIAMGRERAAMLDITFLEAQEKATAARAAIAAISGALADLRMRQASLSQRRGELERDIQRERELHEEASHEADRRESLLSDRGSRQGELELEIQTVKAEAAERLLAKDAHQKEVDATELQRRKLLDEMEALVKYLSRLREKVRTSQREVHQLEMDIQSRAERIGFHQDMILREYNVDLATLTLEEVGTDEYDDLTRATLVAETRDRLQRMGDVNMGAIEEYEAMEQRHDFLARQCEDLREAKDTLLGVIARSDKKIREMFVETFNKIAHLFREFFRKLFNGGQARVYLVDENDPLESGIEIEARPPGKKPTTISLLSGGESAMTAIALLMSILKAKPAPFCILDEVDAPLDDANIGRFLQALDDFTDETQFIVITHNKQSMAKSNAMYGVTMQEKGVSQVISARLEDFSEQETAA